MSSNGKFVLYVESEFQLVNSIDLCEVKSISDVIVFARLNGGAANDIRITNKLSSVPGGKWVFKIKRNGFLKYFVGAFVVILLSLYMLRRDVLVLGDDRSFISKAMSFVPWAKIVFVDDGAYSFVSIREASRQDARKFCWYTRFESLVDPSRNVFYLPYTPREVSLGDVGMIIGAPFSERGIISESDHIKCVRDAVLLLTSKGVREVLYYPHRNEELIYRESLGVTVCNGDVSVEEYLEGRINDFPRILFSWYSTALFLMPDRFEGVSVFYRDIRDVATVNPEYIDQIAIVYEALSESRKIQNIGLI